MIDQFRLMPSEFHGHLCGTLEGPDGAKRIEAVIAIELRADGATVGGSRLYSDLQTVTLLDRETGQSLMFTLLDCTAWDDR